MFTGIVTDIGRVRSLERRGDLRAVIETRYDTSSMPPGASVSCAGACLTVVDRAPGRFAVDVSRETLDCTTLGAWREGSPVNLERPLSIGEEIGGHVVTGHVDAVAEVLEILPDGDSSRFAIALPPGLAAMVAPKGSIAVDGVSLTVNAVARDRFTVNIIPHTRRVTTFGALAPGSRVNLEVDPLARYVARRLVVPEG